MNARDWLKEYYYPPQNVTPQNRCFSAAHIIISTVLFFLIAVIYTAVVKKRNQEYSKRVLTRLAWLMLGLEIFRISWNWYFHGFSLTCFRFDYCNQICMFLPFCIILGDEKLYSYIQVLAIIGGAFVLIYPLWVFYDYAGFHLLALQSMVSHGLMLLCGLIMPYASGEIPSARKETRDSLIGFTVILTVAFIMSRVTGENYLLMRGADGVPVLSLIPYPWYWLVFLPLAFFFIKHLSIIYQDFTCLTARLPLGSEKLYESKKLSERNYKRLLENQKLKLYRIFRPFKYRKILAKSGGQSEHDS